MNIVIEHHIVIEKGGKSATITVRNDVPFGSYLKYTMDMTEKSLRNGLELLGWTSPGRSDELRAEIEHCRQIDAEIAAIKTGPVNLDLKPEDWLPTPEELERLLEDD